MENTTQEIAWLDTPGLSKEQNLSLANKIIQDVEQGTVNPLTTFLQIKSIEDVCKKAKEGINKWSLEEAQKHGAKSFDYMGAKVEVSELGTKYDFSNCGDVIWESLNRQVESLKEQLKDRETFLKTLKGELEIVNPDGGEIYKVHPPVKRSTTGLKITLR